MSCVHPYLLHYKDSVLQVDCGRCMQCRIKKQSALEFLATKELLDVYKSGRGASFVTLTYDDDHIPVVDSDSGEISRGILSMCDSHNCVIPSRHITLHRKDVANFVKNVRRQMDYYGDRIPFKVIYCGELGGSTSRPHYHIIFLGLTDAQVRHYTRKLWKFGLCDIGPLSAGGINYVSKYITKSINYDPDIKMMFDSLKVERPFLFHSVGLGKKWILSHLEDIVESKFTFIKNGKRMLLPRYVIHYVKYKTGIDTSPFTSAYFNDTVLNEYHSSVYDNYMDFDADTSFLRETFLIESARSRGLNVDPVFIASRKWMKPRSRPDRRILVSSLADCASWDDVPF